MTTSFFRPTGVAEACELLYRFGSGAVVVNGGTDIVIEIKKGTVKPEAIVSIWDIPELHAISIQDGFVRIGGAATYREILDSPLVQAFPGMMEAVGQIGSPAIRQVATLAGNLCTAAPAPDGCTMAMGLDAKVLLRCRDGERVVPLSEFLLGRGKTAIQPGELLTAILLPVSLRSCAYQRLARRRAQDIAKVMVGASLEMADGICVRAVIGLGALNAVPCRAYSLEERLTGRTPEEGLALIRDVFPTEAKLRPSAFRAYKEQVVPTVILRTVKKAAERSKV